MIDLHTHTFLSDGDLLPSELVRRAQVAGYTAIAITDHADHSNIDVLLEGLVKVSKELNKYWDLFVIPGVELTHVPLEAFPELVKYARKKGAGVVVGHGESPVEPVLPGTNAAAINAGVDILAHPGQISEEDARLAKEKGVCLEITSRRGHSKGNEHVFEVASRVGADMVLCTDSHSPEDLFTLERRNDMLASLTDSQEEINRILSNSERIVENCRKNI